VKKLRRPRENDTPLTEISLRNNRQRLLVVTAVLVNAQYSHNIHNTMVQRQDMQAAPKKSMQERIGGLRETPFGTRKN